MNLSAVIEELVEERGLDREVLSSIVCEAMLAAYMKKYPNLVLKVDFDNKTGDLVAQVQKEVVSSVKDEDLQISLKKARHIDKKLNVGDMVWLPFDGSIGRIEILRAKQIIERERRLLFQFGVTAADRQ